MRHRCQLRVVLADGSIIHANKYDNSDLFVALKGGAGNFGVVTRFDMDVIEETEAWGGMYICPKSTTPQQIESFVEYVDTMEEKTNTSYGVVWAWDTALKDVIISNMICNTKGVANPPVLAKVLALPSTVNTTGRRGVTELSLHFVLPQSYQ